MKFWLFVFFLFACAGRSAASITITTLRLPNGTVETEYSALIKTSGGCNPDNWKVVSGKLPTGVRTKTLTGNTLELTGTPTVAASYWFTVKVTDCHKHVSAKGYKIVIQAEDNHVVDLRWHASTSTDVVGYNVYRGLDGKTWKKINVSLIASTVYQDSKVANDTTYYYSTTAVDVYGRQSHLSASVKAVIP